MKHILRSLFFGMSAFLTSSAYAVEVPEECYLFSYFLNNGEDGLHLAWSADGLKGLALHAGRSCLKGGAGGSEWVCDPVVAGNRL